MSNPYTDQVHMIVVGCGPDRLNTWVTEKRNVYEEHKRTYAEEPPMISGIAIMTDTDNTGESAEALLRRYCAQTQSRLSRILVSTMAVYPGSEGW